MYAYSRTQCDSFKTDQKLKMTDTPDVINWTLEDANRAMETWTKTMQMMIDRHIPQASDRI
ncbi:hypothetical protein E2C01_056874 [Portunus trituberculatus]|uniref:Uncharacterized protein n=1 Tax=Portunus trituberculatus TaxID=210409 RepID=A0A5B7H1T5_PORTR|nr:hypothetical protein [Portunus trituberculatus]